MSGADGLASRLRRAAHSIESPPTSSPWNLAELEGIPLTTTPRPAAVLLGVIPRKDGAGVVLTRRTEQLRDHAGQVSLPGGRIESVDTSPAQAALREAHEEVGLEPGHAQLLGYLDPYLTITGYRVLPVVAMIHGDFSPRANPEEVADVFEVPLALLLDPAHLEQVEFTFGGRTRHVLQYRYAAHRIWGATAAILYNLRERLAASDQGEG